MRSFSFAIISMNVCGIGASFEALGFVSFFSVVSGFVWVFEKSSSRLCAIGLSLFSSIMAC